MYGQRRFRKWLLARCVIDSPEFGGWGGGGRGRLRSFMKPRRSNTFRSRKYRIPLATGDTKLKSIKIKTSANENPSDDAAEAPNYGRPQ